MRELVRTNDAVLVSAIGALLDGAGIRHLVFDQNMSVLEGSLGVLPRRVLVADGDAEPGYVRWFHSSDRSLAESLAFRLQRELRVPRLG